VKKIKNKGSELAEKCETDLSFLGSTSAPKELLRLVLYLPVLYAAVFRDNTPKILSSPDNEYDDDSHQPASGSDEWVGDENTFCAGDANDGNTDVVSPGMQLQNLRLSKSARLLAAWAVASYAARQLGLLPRSWRTSSGLYDEDFFSSSRSMGTGESRSTNTEGGDPSISVLGEETAGARRRMSVRRALSKLCGAWRAFNFGKYSKILRTVFRRFDSVWFLLFLANFVRTPDILGKIFRLEPAPLVATNRRWKNDTLEYRLLVFSVASEIIRSGDLWVVKRFLKKWWEMLQNKFLTTTSQETVGCQLDRGSNVCGGGSLAAGERGAVVSTSTSASSSSGDEEKAVFLPRKTGVILETRQRPGALVQKPCPACRAERCHIPYVIRPCGCQFCYFCVYEMAQCVACGAVVEKIAPL